MAMTNELYHYGVKGMKWGVRHDKVRAARRRVRNKIGESSGHYNRNVYNVDLPNNSREASKRGWTQLSERKSSMHQFHKDDGVKNQKWLSPDGRREVIFSGKGKNQHINTHPEDEASYNYFSPIDHPVGHTLVDAVPYIFLGNSASDSTTIERRIYSAYENFRYLAVDELDKNLEKVGEEYAKRNDII